MREIIGLLTDFGLRDYYVPAMKAVILSIAPNVRIVDISHEIERWNIAQGAFILSQVSEFFPEDSTMVCVIDPGVGSKRKPILIKGKRHFFVGPDNGVLIPAAKKEGILRAIEIKNEKYMLKRSGTFDGRDIFAPVAAYIARGVSEDELGPKIKEYAKMSFSKPFFDLERCSFQVLHVDLFGNVITNIPVDKFLGWAGEGGMFEIRTRSSIFKLSFSRSYAEAESEIFLIPGSSGFLEISMNMRPASEYTKLKPGNKAVLTKTIH